MYGVVDSGRNHCIAFFGRTSTFTASAGGRRTLSSPVVRSLALNQQLRQNAEPIGTDRSFGLVEQMDAFRQDVARRRQNERGSCEDDGGTSEVGFHPGLGGSFGSLSSLRCALDDDNVNKVDDADTTPHAVWTGEALSMWKGHHAEALSRRPTREAVCPDGVARHSTGMPGDSGVDRHEAHQA